MEEVVNKVSIFDAANADAKAARIKTQTSGAEPVKVVSAEDTAAAAAAAAATAAATAAPQLQAESIEEEEDTTPFVPKINNESEQDRKERLGVRVEANGKIVTIKAMRFTRPKTHSFNNGIKSINLPKQVEGKNVFYYPGKLAITFEEENLIEYYPNVKYFCQEDGSKINTNVSIWREGYNAISTIAKMAITKLSGDKFEIIKTKRNSREVFDISDKDKPAFTLFSATISDAFLLGTPNPETGNLEGGWLIGKKVKLDTDKGVHEGKDWFKNDIVEFC